MNDERNVRGCARDGVDDVLDPGSLAAGRSLQVSADPFLTLERSSSTAHTPGLYPVNMNMESPEALLLDIFLRETGNTVSMHVWQEISQICQRP